MGTLLDVRIAKSGKISKWGNDGVGIFNPVSGHWYACLHSLIYIIKTRFDRYVNRFCDHYLADIWHYILAYEEECL